MGFLLILPQLRIILSQATMLTGDLLTWLAKETGEVAIPGCGTEEG